MIQHNLWQGAAMLKTHLANLALCSYTNITSENVNITYEIADAE